VAIENGVVDATDPTLRGRLDALKVQRDEASRLCAMAEAPAMVVPVIIDEMIERFSHDLRAKLADGPGAMRKEYLRAIVDRIEVDDRGNPYFWKERQADEPARLRPS